MHKINKNLKFSTGSTKKKIKQKIGKKQNNLKVLICFFVVFSELVIDVTDLSGNLLKSRELG